MRMRSQMALLAAVVSAGSLWPAAAAEAPGNHPTTQPPRCSTTLYLSPAGRDTWSGRLPEPNGDRTDGPFASITRARDALRQRKADGGPGGPVTVFLRGGTYPITTPLVFTPEDSGTTDGPITYAAYPGEAPVISGGRVLVGWAKGARGVYTTDAPDARNGRSPFRQLFVNGRRQILAAPGGGPLSVRGTWQLDRDSGLLSLLPERGVDPRGAMVITPVAAPLLALAGDPDEGRFVSHLKFEGLSFQHAESPQLPEEDAGREAAPGITGAIQARGAKACAFERCEVARVGGCAIWLERGCTWNHLVGNHLHDLGAGGVRLGEASPPERAMAETGGNVIANNFIHDAGQVRPDAAGVWVGQSSDNVIAHNEVCDLSGAGIVIGCATGDAPSACRRNRIEFNRLHHLGSGALHDAGALVVRGVATGTVIRNNLIHDIGGGESSAAAGIRAGEGSAGILIENNVVAHTVGCGLAVSDGKDLIVRNNILAFGRDRQVEQGRGDGDVGFAFERNIVYYDSGALLTGGGAIRADRNLYWHARREPVRFPGNLALAEWQASGQDPHSLVADPRFMDPRRLDFRLRPDSPALPLGFRPMDVGACGLVGPREWVERPRRVRRPRAMTAPHRP
ncbi:MAG: right-handed parallel beta-helix repeat-containing protein [Armatimonadetes bacterium]|nr:right-handed parallel beta-helix repeat-containing protein [Armatimonadota bacterium]